jgi:hypothetical protein
MPGELVLEALEARALLDGSLGVSPWRLAELDSLPQTAVSGDVDGDGDRDVVAWSENRLSVIRRGARGSYGEPETVFAAGPHGSGAAATLALGRLNDDQWPDLVMLGGPGSKLRVFTGVGRTAGGFELAVTASTPLGDQVFLSDMDGDGIDEIVALTLERQAVDVFRFTGSSVEFVSGYVIGGNDAVRIDVGDVDADGDGDILVGREVGDTIEISVLRNDGNAGLMREPVFTHDSGHLSSVRLADVDGDERPDLLLAAHADAANTERGIAVMVQTDTGFAAPAWVYRVTAPAAEVDPEDPEGGLIYPWYLQIAGVSDFDSDGRMDIAVEVNENALQGFPYLDGVIGLRVLYGQAEPLTFAAESFDRGRGFDYVGEPRFIVTDLDGRGGDDVLYINNYTLQALFSNDGGKRPSLGSLARPRYHTRPGEAVTFEAKGVRDPDAGREGPGGTIARVVLYADTNGSRSWDAGDRVIGTDTDGTNGWKVRVTPRRWWSPSRSIEIFARARDDTGLWSLAVQNSIQIDRPPVADGLIVLDHPTGEVSVGERVQLRLLRLRDPDRASNAFMQTWFYLDADANGRTSGGDVLLGRVDGGRLWLTVTSTWVNATQNGRVRVVAKSSDGHVTRQTVASVWVTIV